MFTEHLHLMQGSSTEIKSVKNKELKEHVIILAPIKPLKLLISPHGSFIQPNTAGDVTLDVQERIGISNETNIKTSPRATAVGHTL